MSQHTGIDLNDHGTTTQEDLEALAVQIRSVASENGLSALVEETTIADLLALAAQMTAN